MARHRKRRDNDAQFYVWLEDIKTSGRIAVGNFWASSGSEAIAMAGKEYPGLFNKLETQTWHAHAQIGRGPVTGEAE